MDNILSRDPGTPPASPAAGSSPVRPQRYSAATDEFSVPVGELFAVNIARATDAVEGYKKLLRRLRECAKDPPFRPMIKRLEEDLQKAEARLEQLQKQCPT